MLDYEKTEVNSKDETHKLAVAHWDYVKAVLINSESNINHKLFDIIGFHYITAFKHGYKHGKKDSREKKNVF